MTEYEQNLRQEILHTPVFKDMQKEFYKKFLQDAAVTAKCKEIKTYSRLPKPDFHLLTNEVLIQGIVLTILNSEFKEEFDDHGNFDPYAPALRTMGDLLENIYDDHIYSAEATKYMSKKWAELRGQFVNCTVNLFDIRQAVAQYKKHKGKSFQC